MGKSKDNGNFLAGIVYILIACSFFAIPLIGASVFPYLSPDKANRSKILVDQMLLARCVNDYETLTSAEFDGDWSKIRNYRDRIASFGALAALPSIPQKQEWDSSSVPVNPYGLPYAIVGTKKENDRKIVSLTDSGEEISFPIETQK